MSLDPKNVIALDSKKTIVADQEKTCEKLPPDTQFVKLNRVDKNPISVKLPKTDPNQHWCTINVDAQEGPIKCPNSGVALIPKMLKKVVGLANNENNNIIVPISAGGEVCISLILILLISKTYLITDTSSIFQYQYFLKV